MKKYLLFLLVACCSFKCVAQGVSVEKLKNGVWNRKVTSPTEKSFRSFTDSIEIATYAECTTGKWLSATSYMPYYLSEIEPKEFDYSKVGSNSSGKYLVRWNDKMNKILTMEIDFLSDSVFLLKNKWVEWRFTRQKSIADSVLISK